MSRVFAYCISTIAVSDTDTDTDTSSKYDMNHLWQGQGKGLVTDTLQTFCRELVRKLLQFLNSAESGSGSGIVRGPVPETARCIFILLPCFYSVYH